ncbi:DNA repair protein RadC [Salmonella enterica]|nr:DNA repair protein RadC [Salmonella enterica]EKS4720090.1 DNA repair protein RadC [Salmonella enterica]EKS4724546.1 DNA repair protein RadC [Salmonella enterica]EKS4738116.1 DNA repair protein RadC [Salmonella enterica]EKS4775397.1 DNA repair protein RadC [Salmonella enterica]
MTESPMHYVTSPTTRKLIERALKAIRKDYMAAENSAMMTSPSIFIDYLKLRFIDHEREHFGVIFLNNQNQVITTEMLFSGTLNHVEVHPRVIARKALLHNAHAVLLAHNHPSGEVSPSQSDRLVTEKIVQCLNMLDIQVLDHIIISSENHYSFVEHGLL